VETTVLDALVESSALRIPPWPFGTRAGGDVRVVRDGRRRPRALGVPHAALRSAGREVTVRPPLSLPAAPRLVVDMAPFNAKLRSVDATFPAGAGRRAVRDRLAHSAERREIDPAIECIGCGMCVSACTLVAPQPALPRSSRAEPARSRSSATRRDAGAEARWSVLLSDERAGPLPRPG